MVFTEDGSLNTQVGNMRFHLNEEILGKILQVPREGIQTIVEKSPSKEFVQEISNFSIKVMKVFLKSISKISINCPLSLSIRWCCLGVKRELFPLMRTCSLLSLEHN